MREVLKEFPIIKAKCSNALQLYRFPISIRNMNITEVRQKPVSKFVEIKASLPSKNVSALKVKTLNAESLCYRAFPVRSSAFYFVKFDGEKVLLYEIQNIYMFQPFHFYCPFDYSSTKLKKAESREEFEHRMRSINYRLRNVEIEEFTTLSFEESQFSPKLTSISTDEKMPSKTQQLDFKKIEETVKRTRIVNLKTLVQMFSNEQAIKSVLFKMTDPLCGRFILKNRFYEKSLHEVRTKLIQLFKENETVEIKDIRFLGEEKWMVDDIAEIKGSAYCLKGFKEIVEFDSESVRMANLSSIRELLKICRMLSSSQIANELSIDEDTVIELVSNDGFFHLANNAYTLDDDGYVLNDMFNILADKKSFELSELTQILKEKEIDFENNALVEEIKKYCTVRANKFYLRPIKE
ncbi:uncharacterized protein VICG_01471 [Vittaforma corneae ATCC 50505]|uniref:Uncharacterized protein n=1 Tax=Vittaforma corneae (strain ATCC 50505) TaxID=993615 RepID=L2GMG6_VITCO|nr:uncharacterized protein VICG_01471 [Vittaforma corneae ATCC 50505]ELA41487.1 hypothetical protein VICG_01471 [Vittaforma corneae ATCC 50505]